MRKIPLVLCLLALCASLVQAERVEPPAPEQPTPYAACVPTQVYQTQATLAWDKPASTGGGVTNVVYLFERQIDSGPWTKLTSPPLSATQATDGPLDIGHIYTYRLSTQGKTAAGATLQSAYATHGSPPPCVTVMAPPTISLSVTGDTAKDPYYVQAQVSVDTGISVKFEVDGTAFATENASPWCIFGDNRGQNLTGTCYTGKLGPGGHRVVAHVVRNPGGDTLATTSLALYEGTPETPPPTPVPDTPMNLAASPQCVREGIVLTWLTPQAHAGETVTLERQTPPEGWSTYATTKQQSYVDTNTLPGTRYCYRTQFKGSSAWSQPICAESSVTE